MYGHVRLRGRKGQPSRERERELLGGADKKQWTRAAHVGLLGTHALKQPGLNPPSILGEHTNNGELAREAFQFGWGENPSGRPTDGADGRTVECETR